MSRRFEFLLLAASIASFAVAGCAPRADYSARFVRYDSLPDGTRAAVVAPIQQPDDRQTAYVALDDLEPGDAVIVRATGREWDQPQWKPEAEIVGRER